MNSDWIVKLCDFGFARAVSHGLHRYTICGSSKCWHMQCAVCSVWWRSSVLSTPNGYCFCTNIPRNLLVLLCAVFFQSIFALQCTLMHRSCCWASHTTPKRTCSRTHCCHLEGFFLKGFLRGFFLIGIEFFFEVFFIDFSLILTVFSWIFY